MEWVRDDVLARSERPGYPAKNGIGSTVIDQWLEIWRQNNIRSIICLLDENQLNYYNVAGGLIAYYENCGFEVSHIPVKDLKSPPMSESELHRAVEAFQALPKPVLIHCSAGVDRTGATVDFLSNNM